MVMPVLKEVPRPAACGAGRRVWCGVALLLLFAVLPGARLLAGAADDRLRVLRADIRSDFKDVRHLNIDEYKQRTSPTILLDVRSAEEFAVSRLPGARHLTDHAALRELASANPEALLVLYCSVGVRSSRAAQRLQRAGFRNVANLDGSLFAWANRGEPLVNDDGETADVHGFSGFWSRRYLDPRPDQGTITTR